jgi:choline transporter-like protein 2/4/5
VEKICDYLSEEALAYMAVSGESFCTSAWDGFLLNIKHMVKFSMANLLAWFFIMMGRVAIVSTNCISLYLIMTRVTKDIDEVKSLIGPMVVVGVITYIITSIFLGVFDTAVMGLMTCLAIDVDLNEGHP